MATKKASSATKMGSGSSKPDLKQFLGEIEKRAYDIYLERQKTGKPGDDMSDWLQAEKEVKAKYSI